MMKKKKYNGQLASGKLDPNDAANLSAVGLIQAGFHVKTVASITNLTPSQVMYRYRKCGVSPRDYRDGTGFVAQMVVNQISVTHVQGRKGEEKYQALLDRYYEDLAE